MAFEYCTDLTELHVKAVTPPNAMSCFHNVPATIPVYVPCASVSAYQTANEWSNFTNIIGDIPFNLNVQSSDAAKGTVNVTQPNTCANNNTAIIEATPAVGYYFTKWNDNNTQNPRTIILTSDADFTALFEACLTDDYLTTSCDAMPLTIDVLANDDLPPGCTTPVVTVVSNPAHGIADVVNNKISYTGTQSGIDVITYRVACGTDYSEAKVYVTVDASGSAFVDDVWYFGRNLAGTPPKYKSLGIRFVKDGSGNYIAQDASGESMVYSPENSLVVSSPYCDGQNIFYTSHNQLYNALHNTMQNGAFSGHQSTADGLAACYMGDNKYLFFTVTNAYEGGSRGLNAYIVDMNVANGNGARLNPIITIEPVSARMSESIELVARAGTTNQYWLIYSYCNGSCSNNYTDQLRVRLVDVSDPDQPTVSSTFSSAPKTLDLARTMKASQQYNRLAIVNVNTNSVAVYDFNNTGGSMSLRYDIPVSGATQLYGLEFSPDGNQVYTGGYTGTGSLLYQYDISGVMPDSKGSIQYWSQTGNASKGGGLKLGPDGRIYVMQSFMSKVGVMSDPNATTSLYSRYDINGLTLGLSSNGLQFSTGLTKPAIMSCNLNTPPTTRDDDTTLCVSSTSRTVKVNVVKNDVDADNDKVYLTDAQFVNSADATLADITVNVADSTITLTLKNGVTIAAGHVFEIIYDVKDNGLPASQCATGMLRITVSFPSSYPDIRLRVCPDAGKVNLAKYIDTIDKVSAIQWASQITSIPVISPFGTISTNMLASARTFTFTYTITSQCVSDQKRKVYLEVIKNGNVRRLRDTITICNVNADAVQINQIFGIESGDGDNWSYHAVNSGGGEESIDAYVSKSTAPSIHAGAVVMNGKAIYEDGSIPYNSYHGLNNVKIVKITYKADDDTCLEGREFTRVIVLTGN
jgi:hypothetical protein